MARGRGTVNKVILLGRLGADPQLRYTPSGRAAVSFNLATNASWKDQEGNQQERTDWHRITAWGKLAEVMGEWLKKGSYVYLEGRIQTRTYDDANGVKKYITEVVASDMEMLGRRDDGGSGGGSASEGSDEPPPASEEDDLPF
ncbi:single-stranded DNA-binding protein [bacterium I07]|nr:single-stranded DNA-binding protein [bacterium I07]